MSHDCLLSNITFSKQRVCTGQSSEYLAYTFTGLVIGVLRLRLLKYHGQGDIRKSSDLEN